MGGSASVTMDASASARPAATATVRRLVPTIIEPGGRCYVAGRVRRRDDAASYTPARAPFRARRAARPVRRLGDAGPVPGGPRGAPGGPPRRRRLRRLAHGRDRDARPG